MPLGQYCESFTMSKSRVNFHQLCRWWISRRRKCYRDVWWRRLSRDSCYENPDERKRNNNKKKSTCLKNGIAALNNFMVQSTDISFEWTELDPNSKTPPLRVHTLVGFAAASQGLPVVQMFFVRYVCVCPEQAFARESKIKLNETSGRKHSCRLVLKWQQTRKKNARRANSLNRVRGKGRGVLLGLMVRNGWDRNNLTKDLRNMADITELTQEKSTQLLPLFIH